ncbi:cytochrome bd-I ubiquinol oxidase subunit 2 apoprotein [Rhodothalassium salexigens DSM 2132]|uniref:Cytochrome bd-I ubiquinol oxidase subunit 2 apoprotein n=1 Tax=Rhodothalassium salexigens DSM 2132 TaxID=1188247 RepID=A0A4R2P7K4_RHOSA|nr:cytochrome d ubiquinol oxidase subunit II [Rhodothalassium salexigens]MBB4212723.1 cytochrome d ubiquinol oxidase subunit II [Rhodothalassium salexigens DSM 2132]MBK1639226.1 cytochrome d ubiquinol oxidase subunit II [Rhodothalassium salexigens DSM 2132]TCP30174.1 cytochrome bd-I ubiquinol oxidase subunit 2 apoprotein [Rhodothalassium salexigens DSM 2132]
MFDLPTIWAVLLAVAVLAYVILDGFDLGVGILFRTARGEDDRATMMNTIAPVWDGNETWLILGGGGLMAAFPRAYAIIMPALYMPLILMLLALVFRGVAFEYRWRTERWKGLWDRGFFLGSLVAAVMQGIMLGAMIQGVEVDATGRGYGGGWFDWLTPFTIMSGLGLAAGYALLGATWLIWKTEGDLHARCYGYARRLALVLLAFIALVSLWTPFTHEAIMDRWFGWPHIVLTAPVPLLVLAAAWWLFHGLARAKDPVPFAASLCLFVLSYVGLGISFFPYAVPRTITYAEAAAPNSSLAFLLVGASVLLPIILAYTAYAYWVFRGKVRPGEGYH